MPIEGNSHKEREAKPVEKTERQLKPVANGTIEKRKQSFLEKWFKSDAKTIREFLIESIVLPSLIDGVSGIGDILIDSFSDGISAIFEKNGFTTRSRRKGDRTDYSGASKKRRSRRDRDDDDYDDDDDNSISYDNVRVRTKREAEDVIDELKALIADKEYGCASIANLYELTSNKDYITYPDHRLGWTKLNHPTEDYYVRTKHRDKPYLLRLPNPKDISEFL
ncbi:MAG: hypothetical protein J6U54_10115 [Clostridiales bacterium]|nr:hypothetical protein [Clostridiales bacterium]